MRLGHFRIKLDCSAMATVGLVEAFHHSKDLAEVRMKQGFVWFDPDGLFDEMNGRVEMLALMLDKPEKMQRIRISRLLEQNLLVSALGLLEPAILVMLDGGEHHAHYRIGRAIHRVNVIALLHFRN